MMHRTSVIRSVGSLLGLAVFCVSCMAGGPRPSTGRAARHAPGLLFGEPPPLDTIRNALAAGDTAWAVALLTASTQPGREFDARMLTDLLLLRWIGQARGYEDALEPWRAVERTFRKPAERTDAALVFLAAMAVVRNESDRALLGTFGLAAAQWRQRVAEIGARAADSDSLLASAARWVLALDDMRQVRKLVTTEVPTLDALPLECWTGGVTLGCAVRVPPPPGGQLRTLLGQDSSNVLATIRADLDTARAGVWPFDDLGARVRVAVAAMIDDHAALSAFADDTTGLTSRAAAAVRIIAFEFGGQRARAAREMAAHPEWYAALDADRAALGGSRLTPALFWRLAWPLYLEPYNARLVAHRARLLLADVLQHGVADTIGVFAFYGDRAALVQRGVPLGLGIVRSGAERTGGRQVVVSYLPPSTHETVVRMNLGVAPASLDLALAARDDIALRTYSGYVAEDYDRLTPFEHQVMQYVRDGHRMVDVHAERPTPLLCQHPDPQVGFFLLDSRLQVLREVADTAPRRRRYRFRMVLAPGAYVYSLELLDKPCRLAGRARYVLTVPPVASAGLSDLVLAENVFLEEPARVKGDPPVVVRPGLRVSAGSVSFYWEVYGLDAPATEPGRLDVHFEVLNVAQDRVGLRQLTQLELEARRRKPLLDLRYATAVPAGSGPVGIGLSVTVPPEARGVYLARVTVRDRKTGRQDTAERALFVEPQGG